MSLFTLQKIRNETIVTLISHCSVSQKGGGEAFAEIMHYEVRGKEKLDNVK